MASTTSAREGQIGGLRAEPSRFLGRDRELDRLDGEGRLLVVVGPGGMGKTRLALRYGITRRARYASVWFCDMTEARDEETVALAVLRALGIQDGTKDPLTAVERVLSSRPGALVILDNFESTLPVGAKLVARWLAAAPRLRFLVTSRKPLDVGEDLVELGALSLPTERGQRSDAVDLFVDRVRAHRGDYVPRAEELPGIGELVRKLHGVPLAIELAASRFETDDPHDLLTRMHDSPMPGRADDSVAASAHRAIHRAWWLLLPHEREALCQCSVFRGSFSLEAAERVVRLRRPQGLSTSEVLLTLARRNLLQVERWDPLRLCMCEGIRAHAAEMFDASGESSATRWRHAEHYYQLAGAIAGLSGATPPSLADALHDRDDLVAAMELGASGERPEVVLRIALGLDVLSGRSGLPRSQLALLDGALQAGATRDIRLLSRALGTRATSLHALGRLGEARRDADMALRLATECSDEEQRGVMRRIAGEALFQMGEFASALEHFEKALEIENTRADRMAQAATLCHLASIHQSQGNYDRSRTYNEGVLHIAKELGDGWLESRAMMGLGFHFLEAADHARSVRHYLRALQLSVRLGLRRNERVIHGYLGLLYFDAGELDAAEDHLTQSTKASKEAGDPWVEGIFEGVRAAVLASGDRMQEARGSFALTAHLLSANAFWAAAIGIHRGHLDLAEARAAIARGDLAAARKHLLTAELRIEDAAEPATGETSSLTERSDDARLAVRILDRALAAPKLAIGAY